ncbi:MAG TPA: nuclear transport factor 2 family protein [Propionibacteriaceae bacterium]|jgi:ketosteroid isomerase-like protein|nr:nuclear transport factor 2 family protein [Propionibacteriaceae bacterium]
MTAEDDVDQLMEQFTIAQGELLRGNAESAFSLMSHRQDVTLANPLGPVACGWEQVVAVSDFAASRVRDGEVVDVENISKYVTPELAYVVRVERAQAKVGGQQTLSPIALRVTMIMRPEDGIWKVVHRHADPITTAQPAESIIQQ